MEEKRREGRRHLSYYLRLYDLNTGDVIGHLVDLTPHGVRILSEEPLTTGETYKLRLDLSTVMNFEQQIVFDAACIWQEQEFTSGAYNCGLEIKKITSKGEEIIKLLIEQFGE